LKLTLNQKRFLIAWTLFHSFALFVNLVDINLKVYEDGSNTEDRHYVYLGTFGQSDGFWPFTSYYKESLGILKSTVKYGNGLTMDFPGTSNNYYYGGLFNSYGFTEYISYILFALVIIFVPKLWTNNQP